MWIRTFSSQEVKKCSGVKANAINNVFVSNSQIRLE